MAYSFPPDLQQLVQEGLASGGYRSEDDLLLEAVRLLNKRNERLHEFKSQLAARLEQLDRGEGIVLESEDDLRSFFDDVQARGMQRYQASKNAP